MNYFIMVLILTILQPSAFTQELSTTYDKESLLVQKELMNSMRKARLEQLKKEKILEISKRRLRARKEHLVRTSNEASND